MTQEQLGFTPLFYLLNLNRNELSSIAVQTANEAGFEGVSLKEWNTGWSINPVKIGRGYISLGQFDFTENFDEAMKHASVNTINPTPQ